jgi:predicted transposase YbfD/YdcC
VLTTPLPSELTITPVVPCPSGPDATPLAPLGWYLAQVPDHRDPRGRRHPLPAILALVCCGLLCGARHPTAIAEWGRNHSPERLAALGFTRPRTPCPATLHNVLAAVAWEALEAQLRAWALAVETHLTGDPTGHALRGEEAVAVDGKTLRGALKLGAAVTQLVTALGHRLGLTYGAATVPNGDEIAAGERLLTGLVLTGKVVTLDALHTQRDTARCIGDRGGHYLMTVKGNQPTLHAEVSALFAPERAAAQDRESVWELAPGHGRHESRYLLAVSVPPTATGALGTWPGVAQAFVVERQRYHRKQRTGQREVVYGITSLPREQAGPADLLRLLRGHWTVENRSHWVRDVVFGEDASLVHTGQLPQVLALLRTAVISRLRADQVTNIARETRRLSAQPWDCLRLLGLTPDN